MGCETHGCGLEATTMHETGEGLRFLCDACAQEHSDKLLEVWEGV